MLASMNASINAIHPVQIYYEDTDLSGVVYHANYLRYFERAREHLLGVRALVDLWKDEGIGFVVYKAAMTFKEGAELGDGLEIRTLVKKESDYRLLFEQDAYRVSRSEVPCEAKLLVLGRVELACVDADKKLCKLPSHVVERLL
ncbi:MAG: acyl-CoA thioester hydrolase [Polyangiales bacterium]|jgi:acyl-CoA thioester hydrolase